MALPVLVKKLSLNSMVVNALTVKGYENHRKNNMSFMLVIRAGLAYGFHFP